MLLLEPSLSARRMAAQRKLNELEAKLKALEEEKKAELKTTPRDLDLVADLNKDLDRTQAAINLALFSGEYHFLVLLPRPVHSTLLSGPPAGSILKDNHRQLICVVHLGLALQFVLTAATTKFLVLFGLATLVSGSACILQPCTATCMSAAGPARAPLFGVCVG